MARPTFRQRQATQGYKIEVKTLILWEVLGIDAEGATDSFDRESWQGCTHERS